MSWQLQIPVSVFFYRRPDHLRQVMEKVREVRPPVLFGISDGPKPGNEEIRRGVEESRKVFREMVDWPCRWELLEREENLGSYLSVSRGLDWVFERVPETIVLEDDTVPDPSFFRFVAELLEKYRGEEQVGAICGNNYDDPTDWPGAASYRFTRYHHSWGWGTWRRAWRIFDREEKLLAEVPRLRKENWPKLSRKEWAYWERCFRRTYAKKLDAWDYRWTLSLWRHHMVCVIPRFNLVRNIGFDKQATHTVEQDFAELKMHEAKSIQFPLKTPKNNNLEDNLDNLVFKYHYRQLEGRRNLIKKIIDRAIIFLKKKKKRTSISDTSNYRNACLEAATNEKKFQSFKRDIRYKEILEHTGINTGFQYLEKIKQNKILFEAIKIFSQNDTYGNPQLFEYPQIGRFSPSTLRYIHVLKDLLEKFKDLNNLKIAEIGGGYGGQCLVINKLIALQSYAIFDLPEALLLIQKYCQYNEVKTFQIDTLDNYVSQKRVQIFDLVISNYAFSEISRKTQTVYLEKIIINCARGYMIVNEISKACGLDSFSIDELLFRLRKIGPTHIEPEIPNTFPGNKIIWWNWAESKQEKTIREIPIKNM